MVCQIPNKDGLQEILQDGAHMVGVHLNRKKVHTLLSVGLLDECNDRTKFMNLLKLGVGLCTTY